MRNTALRPALIDPRAIAADGLRMDLFQRDADQDSRPYDTYDGIAIIGVYGVLLDHLSYRYGRWATGYNQIHAALDEAFADPAVKGIALDIDSYGGMVAGCFDFVDWAFAAKRQANKPVAAILSEHAYSAAYAIASVADSIAVPRTGGVGSIGVVTMHVDYSAMFEEAGMTVTIMAAGAHKADGNPYEPLPDAVRKDIESELEAIRTIFAETVSRNRTDVGRALSVKAILDTEARTYDGPHGTATAVEIGLADVVASPREAFQAFQQFISRRAA